MINDDNDNDNDDDGNDNDDDDDDNDDDTKNIYNRNHVNKRQKHINNDKWPNMRTWENNNWCFCPWSRWWKP